MMLKCSLTFGVRLLLLVAGFLLVTPVGASVITFDEVPLGTSLSGATVTGVQFTELGGLGFTASTLSLGIAFTNGIAGSQAVFDGTNGAALRLDFLIPASTLDFDFAVAGTDVPVNGSGGAIQLLDSALGLIGTFSLDGVWNPNIHAFEAKFSYSGLSPIGRAVLTATTVGDNHQGILDNVSFSPVPEPASITLVVAGLILVAAKKHRRSPRSDVLA